VRCAQNRRANYWRFYEVNQCQPRFRGQRLFILGAEIFEALTATTRAKDHQANAFAWFEKGFKEKNSTNAETLIDLRFAQTRDCLCAR
jgi:hypothetical protein